MGLGALLGTVLNVSRAVGARGAEMAAAPQMFADQLTQGGKLCPPHYYLTPTFSDLPTALLSTTLCEYIMHLGSLLGGN